MRASYPPSMYNPEYCSLLKTHCRDGFSIASFIDVLDEQHGVEITFNRLIEWASDEDKPEFRRAIQIAQAAEIRFWEEKASSAMEKADSQRLQMAKFMLDQKYALFENIYKRSFNTNTADEMRPKRNSIQSSDPDRDMLMDMLQEGARR